jgi:hypothetical protein
LNRLTGLFIREKILRTDPDEDSMVIMAEQNIIESEILIPVAKGKLPPQGTVVRRIGSKKDQQGFFTNSDDADGLILVSVVDPTAGEFLAEAGILRREKGDALYYYNTTFESSPRAAAALEYLYAWPLYKNNPEMRAPIEHFVRTTYTPEQILLFRKNDQMTRLFVPIQQKFMIGRFAVKIDPVKLRKDRFREKLDSLREGEHITYLAQIPQIKSYSPAFYSAGTKPHYETEVCLQSEVFAFPASHGGHIRLKKINAGKRIFIVDAGSQHKGKGNKTLLSTAKDVADQLKRMYPENEYTPVAGRDAFGSEQSY